MADDPNKPKTPEERLVECSANGTFWEPDKLGGKEPDMNPANAATWNNRTFCADTIRRLAIGDPGPDKNNPWPKSDRPLLIKGARIRGELDLRGATVKRDIWLEHCAFDEMIQLSDSRTKTVSFLGSLLSKGLRARRAIIKGSLYLNNGFVAGDEVNLEDVTITGNLECAGGSFCNKSGAETRYALLADSAKIGGDVRLKRADDVSPRKVFQASGEVHFVDAAIVGNFDCEGGHFHNEGKVAIYANGLSCRNLFLRKNFSAEGTVNFQGVRTHGQVACLGGVFSNAGKVALNLRFADIGSALLFKKADDDPLDTPPASIRGHLDLSQAKCRIFRDSKKAWPSKGELLLDGFTYEHFHDCSTSWRTRRKWLQRQKTDHLRHHFRPQPWTQAIKVLREMGCDSDSRELAICREVARARSKPWMISFGQRNNKRSIHIGSFWDEFLRLAVGYGYKPWRALYWSAGIILFSWLVFALAGNLGYMAPREGSVVTFLADPKNDPTKTALPEHYTEFNALIYAVDVYLPVIELRQNLAWEPGSVQHGSLRELAPDEGWFDCTKRLVLGRNMNWKPVPAGNRPSCGSTADSGWLGSLAAWPVFAFRHGFHRLVYWLEEILGWIFITLLLAGMSGIMKKE